MSLRENLKRSAAEALGGREPMSIDSSSTVAEAIQSMRGQSRGCAIVTEARCPVGILTERDILARFLRKGLPSDTPVSQIMTKEPSAIHEGDAVGCVIRAMHDGGFRNMPVVDGRGALTGVVSIKRVVEYIVEHFPKAVFNLPPRPKQGQAAREGA